MTYTIEEKVSLNLVIKNSPIHGQGVFSITPIKSNCVIYRSNDFDLMANPGPGSVEKAPTTHYLEHKIIKWINHSCKPNAKVIFPDGGISLVSIRDIEANEEITCDYRMTESKLTFSFVCNCGYCSNVVMK